MRGVAYPGKKRDQVRNAKGCRHGATSYTALVLLPLKVFLKRYIPTFYRGGRLLVKSGFRYSEIDGEQRAASFAYYAFLSLFPLILLLITFGSFFLNNEAAVQQEVLNLVENVYPLSGSERLGIIETVSDFMQKRSGAGLVAIGGLIWTSLRFFQALVRAVNRAWGTKEYSWWRLPLRNLMLVAVVGVSLLIGAITSFVYTGIESYITNHSLGVPTWVIQPVFTFASVDRLVTFVVLSVGLLCFFKIAPRKHPRFRFVWFPAVFSAVLLQLLQLLFELYTTNVAKFNVIYGAFGGAVALLMWVYFSGSVIIFGGCLSAILAEEEGLTPQEASEPAPEGGED